MIQSDIHTITYQNGEIQRVQAVTADSWKEFSFFEPSDPKDAFDQVSELYRDYIIPRYGFLLGTIILFRIPEGFELPSQKVIGNTQFFTDESYLSQRFRMHVHLHHRTLCFTDESTQKLFEALNDAGCITVVSGKLPFLSVLPVGKTLGFLSKSPSSQLCVNVSFFTMTPLDITTPFDVIGTTIGMCVKDGALFSPPLFSREALLVAEEASVTIRSVPLSEITVEIDGTVYQNGNNCVFYSRPDHTHTPRGGYDLVITGRTLTAFCTGGHTPIPSSGFVIHCREKPRISGSPIIFHGFEHILFGIQGGNSAVINGIKTDHFVSKFHDTRAFWSVSYPPTLYPIHFSKDRAPRILLGTDRDQKPMILWLEGAGKYGYQTGKGSCGATLAESADIAVQLGMTNAIHLDGGGSAEILLNGIKHLAVSDRDPETYAEKERAVSMALKI